MYLVVVYKQYHDCLILIKYTLVYTYSVMKYYTLLFYISLYIFRHAGRAQ